MRICAVSLGGPRSRVRWDRFGLPADCHRPQSGLDRLVEPRASRLTDERGHGVGAGRLLPAELKPGRGEDDRRVRMDVADVLDQRPRTLGVAAGPDVVDEDVGPLGEVARPGGEDGAATPRRAAGQGTIAAATAR